VDDNGHGLDAVWGRGFEYRSGHEYLSRFSCFVMVNLLFSYELMQEVVSYLMNVGFFVSELILSRNKFQNIIDD
jgi:hypothetical protein